MTVVYSYDEMGNLRSVASNRIGSSPGSMGVVEYEYDRHTGLRTAARAPNGTVVAWEHDTRGMVRRIEHRDAGGALLLAQVCTRDARGSLTEVVESRAGEPDQTWSYEHDGHRRLRTATLATTGGGAPTVYTYSYDGAGNRTGVTVTGHSPSTVAFNSLDQPVADSAEGEEYVYDPPGRMVEVRNGSGEATRRLFWTADDRLEAVEFLAPGSGAPVRRIGYSWDGEGRLAGRGDSLEPDGEAGYLLDGLGVSGSGLPEILETVDGRGAARESWVRGPGVTGVRAGGTLSVGHEDVQRSVRLRSGAAGQEASGSRFDPDPFGEPMAGSATETGLSLRYTGEPADGATGLQHHRARWYSPGRAAWLSPDPEFDFPANFGNAYAYVGNNPTGASDPTGRFGMGELVTTSAIMAELAALDVYGAIQILQPQGKEGAAAAGFIVQMLKVGAVELLSFIPIVRIAIECLELLSGAWEAAKAMYHLYDLFHVAGTDFRHLDPDMRYKAVLVYIAGALLEPDEDDLDFSDEEGSDDDPEEDGPPTEGMLMASPLSGTKSAVQVSISSASIVGQFRRRISVYEWMFDATYKSLLNVPGVSPGRIGDSADDLINGPKGLSKSHEINGNQVFPLWPSVSMLNGFFDNKRLGRANDKKNKSGAEVGHIVEALHVRSIYMNRSFAKKGPGIIWPGKIERKLGDLYVADSRIKKLRRAVGPDPSPPRGESNSNTPVNYYPALVYYAAVYPALARRLRPRTQVGMRKRKKFKHIRSLSVVAELYLYWAKHNGLMKVNGVVQPLPGIR